MTIPARIYVTRRALRVMHDEALNFSAVDGVGENETGGILIGWRLTAENAIVIVEATGPGPNALHAPIEFNPDVETINQQLSEFYRRYPHLDYIGTWHKHPRTYPTYSAGDVDTAHSNFNDPSYAIQEIVNPILHIRGGDIHFNYYYMSKAMAQRHEPFIQIEQVEAIDDQDPRTQPLASIPDRVGAESLALRQAGYAVNVRRDATHVYLTITAQRAPGIILYLIAQPDQQLTLNRIIADTPGGEQQLPELVQSSNNARLRPSLLTIVDTALDKLMTADSSGAILKNNPTNMPIDHSSIYKNTTPPIDHPEQPNRFQRILFGAIAIIIVLAIVLGGRNLLSPNTAVTAIAINPTSTLQLATATLAIVPSSTATIAIPTATPTSLPSITSITRSQTATTAIQNTQSITSTWELYTDRRTGAEAREQSSPPDDDGALSAWMRTLEASNTLVAHTLNILGTSNQPLLQYGARMAGPGSWQIDTRLFTSIAFLRLGRIEEARQQYLLAIQERNGVTVEANTQENLNTLGNYIDKVPQNWDIVNTSLDRGERANALKEIINTLTDRARNPSNTAQTAGSLLADLTPTAQPKPTATRTPKPTATPAPTPYRILTSEITQSRLQELVPEKSCDNEECNVFVQLPSDIQLQIVIDTGGGVAIVDTISANRSYSRPAPGNYKLRLIGKANPVITQGELLQIDSGKYYFISIEIQDGR